MSAPLLSLIIFLPLAGALSLVFIPREKTEFLRLLAVGVSLVVFVLAVILFIRFDSGNSNPQFAEKAVWLGAGIEYHVGIDGISLLLVLLTAFLMPVALLASWTSIRDKVKEYVILMLALETGMLGVFSALNMVLFIVFWEAVLIPMYFLIGMWGGARRIYATMKFVLVTMFGSLLMLVAVFILHGQYFTATGERSFDIFDFQRLNLTPHLQTWLFLAFALAFAVKVPMFPFHTWLPDAHVEAPTACSVILAAVLLKMGAYGFLRFAIPMFPRALAEFFPGLAALAVAGIIYGGLMALIQKDVKSLIAYSSVSHMGLIVLAGFAMNVEGIQGALLQMVNHGLSTGALFLCVGILYERAHTRRIENFGGVGSRMPLFSALFLISILSSLGLPGLNGFAGEILCLFGIFKSSRLLGAAAVSTVVLSAAYLLWMFRRVMHGPVKNEKIFTFRDLTPWEAWYLVPIIVLFFWIGIFPGILLNKTEKSVQHLIDQTRMRERVQLLNSRPPTGENPAKTGRDLDISASEVRPIIRPGVNMEKEEQ